jgi:hypothetical protein
MPDWVRPVDVGFDHLAAQAAIEAAAAMRFAMDRAWQAEDQAAHVALGSWEGAASDGFRASVTRRRRVTAAASGELVALQRHLEQAADDALLAQRRVETMQQAWDGEQRSERAVEALENTLR